jgi:hypothetical protein
MPNFDARLAKLEAMRLPEDINYKIGIFEYDRDNRCIGGTFDGERFECHAGETREAAARRHLAGIGFQGNGLWVNPVRALRTAPVDED